MLIILHYISYLMSLLFFLNPVRNQLKISGIFNIGSIIKITILRTNIGIYNDSIMIIDWRIQCHFPVCKPTSIWTQCYYFITLKLQYWKPIRTSSYFYSDNRHGNSVSFYNLKIYVDDHAYRYYLIKGILKY